MGAKNGLFKIKNRLVNKDQEVRGQVSTTFSEAPNSGLTVDEKYSVAARLKFTLFQFQCQSFLLSYPLFDFGPVFRGDA